MISIICPIYNEERYIDTCLKSILDQDYDKGDYEILLIDGMSSDKTRDIVDRYTSIYPFVKLLDNPQKIVPIAMNIGIENSVGDIIIRIDAHTSYERNYISSLVRNLIELDADNIGAICKTEVLNKNPKSLAIREILCNKFGVGNSLFRIGIDNIVEVDTVPFGCFKRDVFDKIGGYDNRLVRNQDIELNKRLKRHGGKIFLIPDTYCTYYARETFVELIKNNFQNGEWNILTVFLTKQFDSLSIRHFVPLIFVLSLFLPLIGSLVFAHLYLLSIVSLFCYLILLSTVVCKLSFKKKLRLDYLIFAFFVLHFSYGVGSIYGFFRSLFKI